MKITKLNILKCLQKYRTNSIIVQINWSAFNNEKKCNKDHDSELDEACNEFNNDKNLMKVNS